MQVMNGGEYDQKNILIGQAGKTQGFGVTNDPILMSMLSTGLYGNPLRTMLQEIMFNAWDAHHMGNCQDKPIDVYLNETTGLIVRDYGPGIAPDQMHPIYCIYGNSTKRDDKGKTGGFGLGSKSPYAYNDSFTVTSHHNNKKSMYLMNRVSEENNGGPGMTPIIQDVPTEECGLMVTVPFKNERDIDRAYEYIKDISFLSGIKLNLHYKDQNPETIESDSVAPGTWKISDEYHDNKLIAVYGGVRYDIPEDDHYASEYYFMRKLARILGTFYIGFAPDTMTPLPNREGLNLNERTTETIKSQLETMEEAFRDMILPVTRMMLKETFKHLADSGVQPHYLAIRWKGVGDETIKSVVDQTFQTTLLQTCMNACPDSFTESMWVSLCQVLFQSTDSIRQLIGQEKWSQIQYILWAKDFPNHREYKDWFLTDGRSKRRQSGLNSINEIERPRTFKEIIDARNIAAKAAGHEADMRMFMSNDVWEKISNIRGAGKLSKNLPYKREQMIKQLSAKGEITLPSREYPDRLWRNKNGDELEEMVMHKVIIIAKTLAALKETSWNFQAIFCPKYPSSGSYQPYNRSNFVTGYYYNQPAPVAALVIHQKNGGYDKAYEALKQAGYDILEADAPVARVRPKKADGAPLPKAVTTYPLINPWERDWADSSKEEVENPTCYLCLTAHKAENGYSYELPSKQLISAVMKATPRFVILHNKARAAKLEKKKIPDFETKVHEMVGKILVDEERFRKIMLHDLLYEHSGLPPEIIAIPEMQKLFGVPYLRTKQKEAFERDIQFLKLVKERSNWVRYETTRLVKDSFAEVRNDPSVSSVRNMCGKSSFFDYHQLKSHVSGMKPGEQKMFAQKIARFMRTV